MTRPEDNNRLRRVEVVRDTHQSCRSELEEGLRVDTTFDETFSARAQTVEVHRDGSPRRER